MNKEGLFEKDCKKFIKESGYKFPKETKQILIQSAIAGDLEFDSTYIMERKVRMVDLLLQEANKQGKDLSSIKVIM